jgi:ketosteroid isomerase-like protein
MTEPQATPDSDATLTPREVIALHQERVKVHDMIGQAALHAEDVVVEFPFAPAGTPSRIVGRAVLEAMLVKTGERLANSGNKMMGYHEVFHQTLDPELVAIELEVTVQAPDGTVTTLPYMTFWRIRGGEIVWRRSYFSAHTAAFKLSSSSEHDR